MEENQGENIITTNLDNKGRAYATGKRKNSTARVWIKKGSGDMKINGKTIKNYFVRPVLRMMINQPFDVIQSENNFDSYITVKVEDYLAKLAP